jgi:hypothetical protein
MGFIKGGTAMKYYAFTEEQHGAIIKNLNSISITGINQIDAFHEVTNILRNPFGIDIEEAKENEEIHKD